MACPIVPAIAGWLTGSPREIELSRVDNLASGSPELPADLLGKALVELRRVGVFRRLPDALVQFVSVLANQDAPGPSLDAVKDDLGRLRSGRGRILQKAAGALGGESLDVLVGH